VIAMTAAAMQGDREVCIEAGMDDYITKPIRPDTVATTLERWMLAEYVHPKPPDQSESAPAADIVIDPERFEMLRELDGGDGQLLSEIVNEYVADSSRSLDTLREAIAEGDPQAAEREAHTLKGSSANLGAVRVADICAQLEALGRARALGRAPDLVESVTAELALARAALAVELARI
jgi:hypothetical protein